MHYRVEPSSLLASLKTFPIFCLIKIFSKNLIMSLLLEESRLYFLKLVSCLFSSLHRFFTFCKASLSSRYDVMKENCSKLTRKFFSMFLSCKTKTSHFLLAFRSSCEFRTSFNYQNNIFLIFMRRWKLERKEKASDKMFYGRGHSYNTHVSKRRWFEKLAK